MRRNDFSTCSQEFGAKFGAIVALNSALYVFKTASNSLHNFFGDFLRGLDCTTSSADKYLWPRKPYEYNMYGYISTNVDDIIISANNPSKYTNEINQHFQVRDITDSPD